LASVALSLHDALPIAEQQWDVVVVFSGSDVKVDGDPWVEGGGAARGEVLAGGEDQLVDTGFEGRGAEVAVAPVLVGAGRRHLLQPVVVVPREGQTDPGCRSPGCGIEDVGCDV